MNSYFQFYDVLVAAIVGAVEGFTEFLPISSTAHNSLAARLLLNGKDLSLEVSNIFQFGALIAIIQYFWSDISIYLTRVLELCTDSISRKQFVLNIRSWWKLSKIPTCFDATKSNFERDIMLVQLVIATIPAAVIGLAMRGVLDGIRTYMWIGIFLILGSILMGLSEKYYSKIPSTSTKYLSKSETLYIGLFQTLGIFPGISRSGATVSGTFFLGIQRFKAVRFAFLLGIPILALAGIKDGLSAIIKILADKSYPLLFNTSILTDGKISVVGIVVGALASYFVALASLKWLLRYLSTNSFRPFIIYRILLGVFLITISILGYK